MAAPGLERSVAGYAPGVPASHRTHDDADARRRARIGFALSHPTIVIGLALGAEPSVGIVGAALLALHGLVELQWNLADRTHPAGIPTASIYSRPS